MSLWKYSNIEMEFHYVIFRFLFNLNGNIICEDSANISSEKKDTQKESDIIKIIINHLRRDKIQWSPFAPYKNHSFSSSFIMGRMKNICFSQFQSICWENFLSKRKPSKLMKYSLNAIHKTPCLMSAYWLRTTVVLD